MGHIPNDHLYKHKTTGATTVTKTANLCKLAYEAGFDNGFHDQHYHQNIADEMLYPFNPWRIFANRPKSSLPRFAPPHDTTGGQHPHAVFRQAFETFVPATGVTTSGTAWAPAKKCSIGKVIQDMWTEFLDAITTGADKAEALKRFATADEMNQEPYQKCSSRTTSMK